MNDQKVYTVTQLTKDIRRILENTFPKIWVEGEVSNLVTSSAGHTYFSLKDENSLINCVMFKSDAARSVFATEDGMRVLCYGRISLYDKRGQYQLYISKMEPCGKGALQVAFEQLKKKLSSEGLFDEENKKELPFLPVRIGVITSPTGAAVRDILKVIRRRCSNAEVLIRPARVQGDEAKNEVSRAIEEFNEYNEHLEKNGKKDEHPVDVLIVGRGGGSLEDLWAFNEEIVARAIYASKIPIVSAVGHEIDYTISDFVADLRAPTPSAAAELVMPLKNALVSRVDECRERLHSSVQSRIEILEDKTSSLRDSYVLRAPMNVFLQMRQQVDDLLKEASNNIAHFLELKHKDFSLAAGKLRMLSPLAVLDRGYSITFKDGKAVQSSSPLEVGDLIKTRFAQGQIKSRVEEVS